MRQDLLEKDLAVLCDLLVERTMELLKAIEQKNTDHSTFRELKTEVEMIQQAIHRRKQEYRD